MPLAWFSFRVDRKVPNTKNMAQMDHVFVLGEWGAAEDKKRAHMGVFFDFGRWRDGWEGRGGVLMNPNTKTTNLFCGFHVQVDGRGKMGSGGWAVHWM